MKHSTLALICACFIIPTAPLASRLGTLVTDEFIKASIWRGFILGEKYLGQEFENARDRRVVQHYLDEAKDNGLPHGAIERLLHLQQEFVTYKDPKIRKQIEQNCQFILSYPWENTEPREHLSSSDIFALKKYFKEKLPGMEQLQETLYTYSLAAFSATSLFGVSGRKPAMPLCLVCPEEVNPEWIASLVFQALDCRFGIFSFLEKIAPDRFNGNDQFGIEENPPSSGVIADFFNKCGRLDIGVMMAKVDKLPSTVSLAFKDVLDAGIAPLDPYLGIAPDCSQLIIIGTANNVLNIHPELSERMEFMYVPELSVETKILHIKENIINDVAHESGIPRSLVNIDDDVLRFIIEKYTNEAGVNNLVKVIYKLFKQVSYLFHETGKVPEITVDNITEFLGRSKVIASVDDSIRKLIYSLERGGSIQDLDFLHLTPDAMLEASRDLEELRKSMGSSKSSASGHLEWLLSLPWKKREDVVGSIDLHGAQDILDRDHFGLKEVKDRVLDFLAVGQNQAESGKVLCLAGPPGVGKTSIGKSIAEVMGRKFTRVALGGVWNESIIRGWERSYVSAAPGRIIKAIKETGTCNPVILLDEIDKLEGGGQGGDPASALLEVLDPIQNYKFMDTYLGCPFDLSEVVFVVTANELGRIPPALRDRLEIISLPGYVIAEKYQIARDHLIPSIMDNLMLSEGEFIIPDDLLYAVINDYTREAGVRLLSQKLTQLGHKAIRAKLENSVFDNSVAALEKHLGAPIPHDPDWKSLIAAPGVSVGLAWTACGGCIVIFQVGLSAGHGSFNLTGSLGDIAKESMQVAMGYVRSNAEKYGIDPARFDTTDIHIHNPAGATPVDGPSAGTALITAIVSAFTDRPIKKGYAMTGEVDLKGNVWPIGGLKEKLISAKAEGLTHIFIPESNIPDFKIIDQSMLEGLTVIPVSRIDDILDKILE